jgi:hypothetical protein
MHLSAVRVRDPIIDSRRSRLGDHLDGPNRWQYWPHRGASWDPVRGRIAFHPRDSVNRGIWVTYHRAFAAAIGGGEYIRPLRPIDGRQRYAVGHDGTYPTIGDAYKQWDQDRADPAKRDAVSRSPNEEYVEAVRIQLHPGERLEIRAAQERTPLIRLVDLHANRADSWEIEGVPAEGSDPADVGTPADQLDDGWDPWGEPEPDTDDDAKGGSAGDQQSPATAAMTNDAAVATTGPIAQREGGGSTGTQDGTSGTTGTQGRTTTNWHAGRASGAPGTTSAGRTSADRHAGRTSSKPHPARDPDPPADCPPPAPRRLRTARPILDGLTIAGRSVRISGAIRDGRDPPFDARARLVAGPGRCPTDEDESASSSTTCAADSSSSTRSPEPSSSRGTENVSTKPMPIAISDSIVDATRPNLDARGP